MSDEARDFLVTAIVFIIILVVNAIIEDAITPRDREKGDE